MFAASQTVPFNPKSIPGLQLWHKAAPENVVLDGNGNVQTWYDLSGNGYHANQSTTGNRPFFTTTGSLRPYVSTTSAGRYLTSGGTAANWNFIHSGLGATIILYVKSTDITGNYILSNIQTGSSNLGFAISQPGSNNFKFAIGNGTNAIINMTVPNFSIATPRIVTQTYVTGSGAYSYNNNAHRSSSLETGAASIATGSLFSIGAGQSGFFPVNADFYEILIYNRVLTQGEMNSISNYILNTGVNVRGMNPLVAYLPVFNKIASGSASILNGKVDTMLNVATGSGKDLSQTTVANQPIFVSSFGESYVEYSAATGTDIMSTPSASINIQPGTWTWAARISFSNPGARLYDGLFRIADLPNAGAAGADGIAFYRVTAGNQFYLGDPDATTWYRQAASLPLSMITAGVKNTVVVTCNNSATSLTLRINGVDIGWLPTVGSYSNVVGLKRYMTKGASSSGTQSMAGRRYAELFFDRVLTTLEIDQIEAYLNNL